MKKNNNDRGIMIVDDDSDNFIIFGEILRANGFENDFVYCSDGLEMIDHLHNGNGRNKKNSPLPELILLDLNMPNMDGRQALKIIRNNRSWRHIPVIVLTSSIDPQDMDYCFRTGANAFINKFQEFQLLVDNLIDTVKTCIYKSGSVHGRMSHPHSASPSPQSAGEREQQT